MRYKYYQCYRDADHQWQNSKLFVQIFPAHSKGKNNANDDDRDRSADGKRGLCRFRGLGFYRGRLCGRQIHRSHSPNTMSSAPRIAVVSASMWPFDMKSIACKWLNAVGRILQRYGLFDPSATR